LGLGGYEKFGEEKGEEWDGPEKWQGRRDQRRAGIDRRFGRGRMPLFFH